MQNIQLHPYQQAAKDFIMTHPYCALYFDMGLGKTLITLSALYDLNPNGHVLIIAPKNIARSTWIDEIEKWGFEIRVKSFLVNDKGKELSAKKRHELYLEALTAPPTVYFINREKITDLVENIPSWCFPNLVIDESQSFKSPTAKRFKALKKIRPYLQRVIELTGTPAPHGLEDLWSQIFLLDNGTRLGTSISAYRKNFFYPTGQINGQPIGWTIKYGAEQEIYRRISDIVISQKNTAIKLPALTINNIKIHMEYDEYYNYQQMMANRFLHINQNLITAANAATLTGKLSQMASGAIYTEDHDFEVIHWHKVEACEYIIENTNGPVMIAYYFNSDRDMILKYFENHKDIHPCVFDGTPEMLHAWNNRQIPVLLIHPASAGHGLNFQAGGHTLIWYSIPWSLEHYLQTNARLYRQGQQEPVIIHHLITEHTIDEQIIVSLSDKNLTQEDLLQAVKQILYFNSVFYQ